MRRFLLLLFPLFVSALVFAVDPAPITVLDPQSRPVRGARVAIYAVSTGRAVAILSTDAFGAARPAKVAPGQYRMEVLAPGFAAHHASVILPLAQALEIQLRLATASETVNVTATHTE
ncbi:MAG: carboxypeptidase-like regulatory domain-containing protein, partial [Terriglobales bacterium]